MPSSELPIAERLKDIETKLEELAEAINGHLARLEASMDIMVASWREMNVELQTIRGMATRAHP